jgi:nitric oxide reductase NorQ protein
MNNTLSHVHSTDEMTATQLKKGKGIAVTDAEIASFVKDSYKLKPVALFLPELTWKFAVRNVLRGENILLVGPAGSAKTMTAHCLVDALKRPFFNIPLGSTQDPRASLIGNTHYSKERGTYFSESYFVNAIRTPNAIILLDELSRAHPEAWNILMPVLDNTQRYLRLEEKEDGATVPVAEGVSFVATANIGNEYTSTRVLDRALIDRFTIVEVSPLDTDQETALLEQRYPKVEKTLLRSVAEISTATRKEARNDGGRVSTSISTRASVKVAGLLNDGFTLQESAEVAIFPFFSADGGAESERTFVKQLVQKYCGTTPTAQATPKAGVLFTDEEIAQATK